jgi:hypothetical protein
MACAAPLDILARAFTRHCTRASGFSSVTVTSAARRPLNQNSSVSPMADCPRVSVVHQPASFFGSVSTS